MSIILMVNVKSKETVSLWEIFESDSVKFGEFFQETIRLPQWYDFRAHEQNSYLQFLMHEFTSLETKIVREQVLRLVGRPLWLKISANRRILEIIRHDSRNQEQENDNSQSLNKYYQKRLKKKAFSIESTFIPSLLEDFLDTLALVDTKILLFDSMNKDDKIIFEEELRYCQRFIVFCKDLISQFFTRRYFRVLLEDKGVVIKCQMSILYNHEKGFLFRQLVDLFKYYIIFPIDDFDGVSLSGEEVALRQQEGANLLQRLCYKYYERSKKTENQQVNSLFTKLIPLIQADSIQIHNRSFLEEQISLLTTDELHDFVCLKLKLLDPDDPWVKNESENENLNEDSMEMDQIESSINKKRKFLIELFVQAYEQRPNITDLINSIPLYPTEEVLFDENQIPTDNFNGDQCLALPKLNLQFLSFEDYLLRNFHLFRLEASYEIRDNIVDAVARTRAQNDYDQGLKFQGWARMATVIEDFKITEVKRPPLQKGNPSKVLANLILDISKVRQSVKREWDELKQHDVIFLLSIQPPDALKSQEIQKRVQNKQEVNFQERFGLVYVRGAEIEEVLDEEGNLMNDFTGRVKPDQREEPKGVKRTLVLQLDPVQYQQDITQMDNQDQNEDVYQSFNVAVRRKPKENNFKAVLQSIRDLLNENIQLPEWLRDIVLGYGEPDEALYTKIDSPWIQNKLEFEDTFQDLQHIQESYRNKVLQIKTQLNSSQQHNVFDSDNMITDQQDANLQDGQIKHDDKTVSYNQHINELRNYKPPYRLEFQKPQEQIMEQLIENGHGTQANGHVDSHLSQDQIVVERYQRQDQDVVNKFKYLDENEGLIEQDDSYQNRNIRFTPIQVQAIFQGTQPGLTMIVGPPGTGKTDTAVQILHLVHHNFQNQRTLVIAHSNLALNDLFQKVIKKGIPARYLLRLGMGEQDLESDIKFSRLGRVNAILKRRLELLVEVEKLAKVLQAWEGTVFTCENSKYFYLNVILASYEKFLADCEQIREEGEIKNPVSSTFPYLKFFQNQEGTKNNEKQQDLFLNKDDDQTFFQDLSKAKQYFQLIQQIFDELEEYRPFELLKGQGERVNYLLQKQAKIVAMTCTHAALKRREFMEMKLQYDNIIMEESAQILEIETFIPLLIQKNEATSEESRLKRIILIGDHNQLPPVVKNPAFQNYSRLDQSMFTRFIRLGVPYLELDAQGRSRPSLAKLYNWRYRNLGDLQQVRDESIYKQANPGFLYDYQFINVEDYQGQGEFEPQPYFYQNLGEAEMIACLFKYMVLQGYPPEKITILSTYNGQKDLLRDVIHQRCNDIRFGRPQKITTVDKFQGQQNDYIILSLVRTKAVGHFRDVRRLVVATSRARLGLYVFGRFQLFNNCFELQNTFKQFASRDLKLNLVQGERHSQEVCKRALNVRVPQNLISQIDELSAFQNLVNNLEQQMYGSVLQ